MAAVVYTIVTVVVLVATIGAVGSDMDRVLSGEFDSGYGETWSDGGFTGSEGVDPDDPFYDYPGYEDGDSGYLMAADPAEEIIAAAEAAIGSATTAIASGIPAGGAAASDASFERDDTGYYKRATNSYGGASLLYDYVSDSWTAQPDLRGGEGFDDVLEDAETALAAAGYDTFERIETSDEWFDYGFDTGYDDADNPFTARSMWVMTAYSSTDYDVPAVEVTLFDLANDESGAVAEFLDDDPSTVVEEGVRVLAYSSQMLESDDRDEFVRRMEPFGGVEEYVDPFGSQTTVAMAGRAGVGGAS